MKLDKQLFIKISCSILVVIVLILLLIFLFNNYKSIHLKNTLGKLGNNYYEGYYYDEIEGNDKEVKDFLKLFNKTGLKISLRTLSSYDGKKSLEKIEEFTFNKCDLDKTYIIIYPNNPYDKDSYKIKKYLECK